MASYVDTSVVAAFAIENHENHETATEMVDNARSEGQPFISVFTIVELCSVVSRNVSKWGLLPPLEEGVSPHVKVRSTVEYALRKLNPQIVSDEPGVENLGYAGAVAHRKFCETAHMAPGIKLNTGDLLHVAYASELKKKGKVDSILALDKSFKNNKEDIKAITGLDVVKKSA